MRIAARTLQVEVFPSLCVQLDDTRGFDLWTSGLCCACLVKYTSGHGTVILSLYADTSGSSQHSCKTAFVCLNAQNTEACSLTFMNMIELPFNSYFLSVFVLFAVNTDAETAVVNVTYSTKEEAKM